MIIGIDEADQRRPSQIAIAVLPRGPALRFEQAAIARKSPAGFLLQRPEAEPAERPVPHEHGHAPPGVVAPANAADEASALLIGPERRKAVEVILAKRA